MTELELEVVELRREIKPLRPLRSVSETFGLLADDPEFEYVVRLEREYWDQFNNEEP